MRSKHYKDGWRIGRRWTENYTPGGPYVSRANSYDKPEKQERAKKSKKAHDEWMQGFNDGLACKKRKETTESGEK